MKDPGFMRDRAIKLSASSGWLNVCTSLTICCFELLLKDFLLLLLRKIFSASALTKCGHTPTTTYFGSNSVGPRYEKLEKLPDPRLSGCRYDAYLAVAFILLKRERDRCDWSHRTSVFTEQRQLSKRQWRKQFMRIQASFIWLPRCARGTRLRLVVISSYSR